MSAVDISSGPQRLIDNADLQTKGWANYFNYEGPGWSSYKDLEPYTMFGTTSEGGDSLTVVFTGVDIIIYGGNICNSESPANCSISSSIDGGPSSPVNISTDYDMGVLYTISGLDNDTHELRLSGLSTSDAEVRFDCALSSLGSESKIEPKKERVSVRCDDGSVQYSGSWEYALQEGLAGTREYMKDSEVFKYMASRTVGDSLSFTFLGSEIAVLAGGDPKSEADTNIHLTIVIDDGPAAEYTFEHISRPLGTIYTSGSLPSRGEGKYADLHTIKVTITGTNPGQAFFFHRFAYVPSFTSLADIANLDDVTPGELDESGNSGTPGPSSTGIDDGAGVPEIEGDTESVSLAGPIAGSVVGFFAIVALLTLVVCWKRRRRQRLADAQSNRDDATSPMIHSPPRNPTQPVPYTKAYSGGVDSQTATAAPTNPTTPVPYQKTHAHDTAADTVEQGSSSNASTSITPFADSTARTSTSRTMDRTQTTTERPARDELDGSASVVGLDASLQSGQSASGLRETIRVLTERMNELDVPPPYEDDREVRPP